MIMQNTKDRIVYLVSAKRKFVNDLKYSLPLLHENYLKKFPCEVMMFHEADFTAELQSEVAAALDYPLVFRQIEFPKTYPPGLGDKTGSGQFPLGYRYMCHFFANEIFNLPEMSDCDYYMRLDTDSYILSPVRENLFDFMRSHSLVYGYIGEGKDARIYSEGFWRFAEKFAAGRNFKTYKNLYSDIPERRYFYTNFEICDCGWFRRAPWTDFFAEIEKNGGIYTTRWGDHIIRYVGVNLFAPPESVALMPVHYYHQGEYGRQFGDGKLILPWAAIRGNLQVLTRKIVRKLRLKKLLMRIFRYR